MEDIVALRVVLDEGPDQYFLTWGRLLDPVETKSLEELVGSHLSQFALPRSCGLDQRLRLAAGGIRDPLLLRVLF